MNAIPDWSGSQVLRERARRENGPVEDTVGRRWKGMTGSYRGHCQPLDCIEIDQMAARSRIYCAKIFWQQYIGPQYLGILGVRDSTIRSSKDAAGTVSY